MNRRTASMLVGALIAAQPALAAEVTSERLSNFIAKNTLPGPISIGTKPNGGSISLFRGSQRRPSCGVGTGISISVRWGDPSKR